MELYERKTRAYELIDSLLASQTDHQIIYFKVATQFGLSEKFVNNRIESIEKLLKSRKIEQVFSKNEDISHVSKDISPDSDQKSEENQEKTAEEEANDILGI